MSAGVMAAHYVAAGGGGFTDPRSITGLLAWYSAQAETGYANNAQMTGWTDLSGNGNHATAASNNGANNGTEPLWQSTSGAASGPAVYFPNDGYFVLPTSIMGSATSGEIMVTIKSDGSSTGLWDFGTSGDASHYAYSGVVYDSFGNATRYSFTPSLAITSWRRFNVWSAASDWAARLDETTQSTSASNTVAWDSAPLLGKSRAGASFNLSLAGHMACVVLYNRKLTTTERADLATWMAANPSGGTV